MRGYSNQQRIREKRHLSVVCRDYDDEWVHCNGINSLAVRPRSDSSSHASVFSASRDRLIKLWDVDYTKLSQKLVQPG